MRYTWSFTIIISLLFWCRDSIFAQQSDCSDARIVCNSQSIIDSSTGPGGLDFDMSQSICGVSEHESTWIYFEFNELTPPGTLLEFDIFPTSGEFSDFDFAIFGPNVECGNLGNMVRCEFHPDGYIGLKEGVITAGPYEEALPVNANESYYLLVDNFSEDSASFTLIWGGAAADYLTCVKPSIPTLSQWGLFLFGLIFATLGLVLVYQRQTQLSGHLSGGMQINMRQKSLPFYKDLFKRCMTYAIGIGILGFGIIQIGWGEILSLDVIGVTVSIPIIAYALHVVRMMRGER